LGLLESGGLLILHDGYDIGLAIFCPLEISGIVLLLLVLALLVESEQRSENLYCCRVFCGDVLLQYNSPRLVATYASAYQVLLSRLRYLNLIFASAYSIYTCERRAHNL